MSEMSDLDVMDINKIDAELKSFDENSEIFNSVRENNEESDTEMDVENNMEAVFDDREMYGIPFAYFLAPSENRVEVTQELITRNIYDVGPYMPITATFLFGDSDKKEILVRTQDNAPDKFFLRLFPYLFKIADKDGTLKSGVKSWRKSFQISTIADADGRNIVKEYFASLLNCVYGGNCDIPDPGMIKDLKLNDSWRTISSVLQEIARRSFGEKEQGLDQSHTQDDNKLTLESIDEKVESVTCSIKTVELDVCEVKEQIQKLDKRIEGNENKICHMTKTLKEKHPDSIISVKIGSNDQLQLTQSLKVEISSDPNSDKKAAEKEAYFLLTVVVEKFYDIPDTVFSSIDPSKSRYDVKLYLDHVMKIFASNGSENSHVSKEMSMVTTSAGKRKAKNSAIKFSKNIDKATPVIWLLDPVVGTAAIGVSKCAKSASKQLQHHVCTLQVEISKTIDLPLDKDVDEELTDKSLKRQRKEMADDKAV